MKKLNAETALMQSVQRLTDKGFAFFDDISVRAIRHDGPLTVKYDGRSAEILYNKKVEFFRGLSLLEQNRGKEHFELTNQTSEGSLTLMADMSRAATLNFEGFKSLIKTLADLGYTGLQLYTEDTFQIPEEPFFGHMRGRFSHEELKRMDSICADFGIELIPCIQTLAHFNMMFKWPHFSPICDVNDILLCGEDKTYEFLDNLFKTIAECFTSRNVNIGMDEAHLVGLGQYLDKHGYTNRFELLSSHLKKVLEIAERYGFKASMWSDMYFRLFFKGNYYPGADEPQIPAEITEKVPQNVELIYWDYYHNTPAEYENLIQRHKKFNNKTIFAGGAWRWAGFAPFNAIGLRRAEAALEACNNFNIKDIILTAWGDNGNECPLMSAMPQIVSYSEYVYTGQFCEKAIDERLQSSTGVSLQDYLLLDRLNGKDNAELANPCKYLLYNDPMAGLHDYYAVAEDRAYYSSLQEQLTAAAARSGRYSYLFETAAALAGVLSLKSNLGNEIIALYEKKDKKQLMQYSEKVIPDTITALEKFIALFRKQWLKTNKFFGLEIHSLRLGGLIQRLKDTKELLYSYSAGEIDRLPELEEPRLCYINSDWEKGKHQYGVYNEYSRISSANTF